MTRQVHALIVLVLTMASVVAGAHEISFSRSTIRTDDYVTLTIVLEEAFVATEHVRLPLENLVLVGGPSTSTEFRWVNGETSRRKVLTYRLRPESAGTAAAGPVVVTAPNGDQLTLKRVAIDVVDPVRTETPRQGELSLSRLPAVVVEVSPREALVGEQIEVRWSLYGENIRGVQLLELPSLDGFWVEQLEADETNREVIRIGDELIQRQTLRHALLYPIREGTFEIAPLTASVRVYRRDPLGDVGGWNPFGGAVSELTRRSETVRVEVSASPDESLPVGSFELACSEPRVPLQGPVAIDLRISGTVNLRAVSPPEFSRSPAAGVELEALATSMHDRRGGIVMQRGWRYLLFPERKGSLDIPPVRFSFFDPAVKETRTATCGGWSVTVDAAESALQAEPAGRRERREAGQRAVVEEYWIPAVVTAAAILLLVPLLLRMRRRDDRRLMNLVGKPAELRSELEAWLVRHGHHPARLNTQPGDVGEAWRVVSSLLDLVEREP
ncbi:MAG: BatD family protein, partial [Acidobacteria bacterium]|nr:BatD family protein [Acidobacteriota bacterium]